MLLLEISGTFRRNTSNYNFNLANSSKKLKVFYYWHIFFHFLNKIHTKLISNMHYTQCYCKRHPRFYVTITYPLLH